MLNNRNQFSIRSQSAGLKRLCQRFYSLPHSLPDRYHDFRLGIKTCGQFFHANPENKQYDPLLYHHLFTVVRQLQVGPDDVFLDYGCGKGRVLVAAALRPFHEVIGVDLSPELCEIARANVRRARGLCCRNIRIVCADAISFDVPDSVTVLYFYNPFTGSILRGALAKVRQSLDRRPRAIHTIFLNYGVFADPFAGLGWVRTLEEFSLRRPLVCCRVYQFGP